MNARPAGKSKRRTRAMNCALVNQLATPGLGSLMARRYVAGTGQLLLAIAGFALVVLWFVLMLGQTISAINNDTQPKPYGWVGELGGLLFILAWFWSLVTSLSLLREAKAEDELVAQSETPPPLPDQS